MRPIKLEIEGFTSFRERTVIDFTDTDLFVLTGATGSGKSSVIDAMTFALYGSIPRLDNKSLVAPVMSRGLLQTLVRLDFALGDKTYTAVRVLKPTNTGGATTTEARLEDADGNTLAANERELSDQIEELLGIPFEHFIKCVVLPQGDFSDFMHAKPGDRQGLLIDLLGLDLFDQVTCLAGQKKSGAEGQLTSLHSQIENLETSGHSDVALKKTRARIKLVKKAQGQIAKQRPKLEELKEKERSASARVLDIEGNEKRLKSLKKPDGVGELSDSVRKAAEAALNTREKADKATGERQSAQEKLDSLPNEVDTRNHIQRHQDLAAGLEGMAPAKKEVAERKSELAVAREALDGASEALTAAQAEKRRVADTHRAFHLADGLEPGQTCPVCYQTVEELPEHETPAEESVAAAHLTEAEGARESCSDAFEKTNRDLTVVTDRLEKSVESAKKLEKQLADVKELGELEEDLATIEAAKDALTKLNEAEKKVLASAQKAERAKEDLEEASVFAWQSYDTVRDQVAKFFPPAANREDLASSWDSLVSWAEKAIVEQKTLREIAEREREEKQTEQAEIHQAIEKLCADIDLEIVDDDAHATCAVELSRLENLVEQISTTIAGLKELRGQAISVEAEAKLAAELSRLLNARNFKRWLMTRVLRQLSDTASVILNGLSSGAYSLTVDDTNNFSVIDHRNANEQRPIRTLSGGETFLASLALALALSEHLADLAVAGSTKLEALFLDEGFGTLDADTLDVVTTAIEELGARGRMIGIVTHVKELAERIPVRYEVSKEGNRSSVKRVAA